MNRVILSGNLGADPQKHRTKDGGAVVSFSLAVSERWKDAKGELQERTHWFRVAVFGKLAETCAQYLEKGRKCLVEGRLETNTWDDNGETRHSTEIIASHVEFLSAPTQERKPAPKPERERFQRQPLQQKQRANSRSGGRW